MTVAQHGSAGKKSRVSAYLRFLRLPCLLPLHLSFSTVLYVES